MLVCIPKPHLPVGGCLKHFVHEWKKLTHDPEILQIVSGMKISLTKEVIQTKRPFPFPLSYEENLAASEDINTLLAKGAIVPCSADEEGQFISTVFLTPKKDGGYHMILI